MLFRSTERDAIRILFLLYFCGTPKTPKNQMVLEGFGSSEKTVIDSEIKLQKLDFWLRYPDHLAAALLRLYQTEAEIRSRKDEIRYIVKKIFDEQEPVLRIVPMRKYLFGAYEPLDNVISFLHSRGLVIKKGIATGSGYRTQYFLTIKGGEAVERILQKSVEAKWYKDRCLVIQSFFNFLSGNELKEFQYQELSYATTQNHELIKSIELEVRQRFNTIFGEPL